MRRAFLVLAVGAALLLLALRARRDEAPPGPVTKQTVCLVTDEPLSEPVPVTNQTGSFVPATKRTGSFVTAMAPTPTAPKVVPGAPLWGVVTLMGERPPRKRVKTLEGDPACSALHAEPMLSDDLVVGHEGQVRWAMVYVKKGLRDLSFDPPKVPARMDQIGCRYVPHVLAVMTGQTIEFVNSDPVLHNVHALPFANKEFNACLKRGQPAEQAFDTPEFIRVKCDIHPWMSAWIGVFGHPFAAVTDEEGVYRLPGLPPGRYEIEAWHEGMKSEAREVDVAEPETRLDFLLQRR